MNARKMSDVFPFDHLSRREKYVFSTVQEVRAFTVEQIILDIVP